MTNYTTKSSVLFLVFNRPDTTEKVFRAIQDAKPAKLYLACDGPRKNNEKDKKNIKEVREFILNSIDWECEVKTRFQSENLGCKSAVSSAITWFFENEEEGIILEDDCLPNQSFFRFCDNLLEKYRSDDRIWHITGHTIIPNRLANGQRESYYFSYFNHVWGWATWADRWKYYDVNLENIKDDKFLYKIFKRNSERKYWSKIFHQVKNKEIDTWDYQWAFACWNQHSLSIVPWKNLISNIGFGERATHTIETDSFLSKLKRYDLDQIIDPEFVIRSVKNDDYESSIVFIPSLFRRVKLRLIKILHQKRSYLQSRK